MPSPTSKPPWALTFQEVLVLQGTDPSKGLFASEAAHRLSLHGPNEIATQRSVPVWRKFLHQFQSPVVLVLVGAVFLSLFLGDQVDALVIAAILALNALVGWLQESKAKKAIEALKRTVQPKARVLREGQVLEIPSPEVVLGDLLVLEAGDFVAADARVVEERGLSVDEAALTGESLAVDKEAGPLPEGTAPADRVNMLFSGTAISVGTGKAVVIATAAATEFGRIADLLASTGEETTPLQKRLERMSHALLWFCGGVVTVVGVLNVLQGQSWLDTLLSSISLAVAAIPEGLPAVVTLALALSVRRLTRKNALMRKLASVETLGSTDVICTDKTGTLTTGHMSVREVAVEGGIVDRVRILTEDLPAVERVLESCVICSTAVLAPDGKGLGDPTEIALLELAAGKGLRQGPLRKRGRSRAEWPFDSDRKRMSVAQELPDSIMIHVKGAPEAVLPFCSLSPEKAAKVEAAMEELSGMGRRLLAVAVRKVPSGTPMEKVSAWVGEAVERDLTFLGLVSLADPPRPEAIQAVANCRKAGIRVVMITGDHPVTARAIAREMGILMPGAFEGVLTGTDLSGMSPEELGQRVDSTAVYARVSPEHKLRIVQAWQRKGKVTAMTGDGVNDAPALKAASIGVAMGKGGTEVARQASAMVLSDDNFATLVSAVGEGRAIHANIRRTIRYLLTGNMGEILVMLGAALVGWPSPLLPIHLLWINLVTDGFPALALAAEPVPKDVLTTTQRSSLNSFSNPGFYGSITLTGLLVAALTLAVYGWALGTQDEVTARTYAFSFLVFEELFRSFAGRSDRRTFLGMGASGNLILLAAAAFPLAFQLGLLHLDWAQGFFKVKGLEWDGIGFLLGLALVPVTLIEVGKLLRKPNLGHDRDQ